MILLQALIPSCDRGALVLNLHVNLHVDFTCVVIVSIPPEINVMFCSVSVDV